MIALLRKIFWLALFGISTFCFYVFFEHGTENFQESARTEFENLKTMYEKQNKEPAPGSKP